MPTNSPARLRPGTLVGPCMLILTLLYIMTCLFLLPFIHLLIISIYHYADDKKFEPDLNTVHVRDLNFVLRSEIFVHFDEQLRASHLILSCTPVYTRYQPLGKL